MNFIKDKYKVLNAIISDGITAWLEPVEKTKVTLVIELDATDYFEDDYFEVSPNDPDTKKELLTVEEQLDNIDDKELLIRTINHLKTKLNKLPIS